MCGEGEKVWCPLACSCFNIKSMNIATVISFAQINYYNLQYAQSMASTNGCNLYLKHCRFQEHSQHYSPQRLEEQVYLPKYMWMRTTFSFPMFALYVGVGEWTYCPELKPRGSLRTRVTSGETQPRSKLSQRQIVPQCIATILNKS